MGKDISAALSVSFLTIAAGSAFGVWTGVGPIIGMLSMAVASIVGVVFGGIQVKTSGPTGPTAGLMFTTIAALSAVGIHAEIMMFVLLASALFLLLLSFIPIEKYIGYVPHVSIAIFVNGISLFIIFKQLLKILNFNQLALSVQVWETGLVIGAFFLLSLWPRIAKTLVKIPGGNIVSGSLAVMFIGSIVVFIFSAPVSKLNVESINFDAIFPGIPLFDISSGVLLSLLPHILKITFILAFITIVTARALHSSPNYGRELRNQGIANAAVAFIGGIPVTIGFMRTKLLNMGALRHGFLVC